jgi:predicted transcriptional regulator of viral defense system
MYSRWRLKSFPDLIDELQAKGKYSFVFSELIRISSVSEGAARKAVQRLQERRRIARVWQDFWVIVPLEYSSRGMLPPEWFIDDLMRHVGKEYCVGLLSAAALHGAAHQQPQVFQVLVPGVLRSVRRHGVHIRFYMRKCDAERVLEKKKTPTGYLVCTRAELTLIHLVAFMNDCGGIHNVYSVIDELAESLDSKLLEVAAAIEPRTPVLQRAGWMLERLGHERAANDVQEVLSRRNFRHVPLATTAPADGAKSKRWKIIENTIPEMEY